LKKKSTDDVDFDADEGRIKQDRRLSSDEEVKIVSF